MKANFEKMRFKVEAIFKISLWNAIKLRIAGREVRERVLELKEQVEEYRIQKPTELEAKT